MKDLDRNIIFQTNKEGLIELHEFITGEKLTLEEKESFEPPSYLKNYIIVHDPTASKEGISLSSSQVIK